MELLKGWNIDYALLWQRSWLALLVLLVTFISIKVTGWLLDWFLARLEREEGAPEQGNLRRDLLKSLGVLLKALLFYGGYFVAALIILEIFRVSLLSPGDLKELGLKILKVIGIVIGARLAVRLGRTVVGQIFARHELHQGLMQKRRAQTLQVLLQSMVTYVLFFVAFIMILQVFGVNTSAILASAGILGLAVGFGAQSLVKDVISGFFILFEDQFAVGDYVETAGVVGVVEEMGLRSCKIRAWTGQLHIVPNGEISKVTNYNRGHMLAVVVVGIAYEADVDRALEVLRRAGEQAKAELPDIVETPVVQGVVELADSAVNIRVVAATRAGQQWEVERQLRRRFKLALEAAGIEIPYPRRVIYQR